MNLELVDKVGGRSNESPLTQLGIEQSQKLGVHLRKILAAKGIAPHAVKYFSSTAVRTIHTAQLMMAELGIDDGGDATLTTTEELLEQDMGEWEGAQRSECYTPENLTIINANTHTFAAPGGESQQQVESRIIDVITTKVLPQTTAECPSIVIGHGMAFKCLLRHIFDSDARMTRKIGMLNTAVTEIAWVPENGGAERLQPGWHVLRVNDSSHLEL